MNGGQRVQAKQSFIFTDNFNLICMHVSLNKEISGTRSSQLNRATLITGLAGFVLKKGRLFSSFLKRSSLMSIFNFVYCKSWNVLGQVE